jgi:hypothetical protein
MKTALLLAALIAPTAISTALAGDSIYPSHIEKNQPKIVRAEARMLGGRADRSVILVSLGHREQTVSTRNTQTPSKVMPAVQPGITFGGRNSPR